MDLRWQSDLSEDLQKKITRNQPVNRYLSQLGLVFYENGLTEEGT